MKCPDCKKQKRADVCQACFLEAKRLNIRIVKAQGIAEKRRRLISKRLHKSETGRKLAVKEIYKIGLIITHTPMRSLNFRLREYFGI